MVNFKRKIVAKVTRFDPKPAIVFENIFLLFNSKQLDINLKNNNKEIIKTVPPTKTLCFCSSEERSIMFASGREKDFLDIIHSRKVCKHSNMFIRWKFL